MTDSPEATASEAHAGQTQGGGQRRPPLGPMWLAALAGAAAGLYIALADYGAMWLWVPGWWDRLSLLGRLIASLSTTGFALGAVGWLGWWLGSRAPGRLRAFGWPWPVVLAASPLTHWMAAKLCSGGGISRLPYVDGLRLALQLLLPVALWAALLLARAVVMRGPTWRVWALLGLAAAGAKVNQLLLPNLYDYLHATLALMVWSLAALGFLVWLRRRSHSTWLWRARWPALVGCLVAGAINFSTLDANLNVRVAMFDPRTATSRALLMSGEPLLRWASGEEGRRQRRKARTRPKFDTSGLPELADAHILLITIDALRADHLGSYGYGRPVSPGLDLLASQSVRFDRAYAQAPHSSYSISSLMTSEYVHEVVDLDRELPHATLASTLREAGYHTAAFYTAGIFHTEGKRLARYRDSAFDFALYDHTDRDAEETTDRVLAEVDRIRAQGEPPSLLWAHYFDVHEPYVADTFGKSDLDRYDSEILRTDGAVRRLVDSVRERFAREVVIAVTADHGEEFRDHGGVYHGSTLYEEQVRVPLIVSASGLGVSAPAAPVEVIDLAPTLLGLVGVKPAPTMRGRDLRPVALGLDAAPTVAFSAVMQKRMAVRWPLKLIADLRFSLFELYDLEQDPRERHNLANARPEDLKNLQEEVYDWLDALKQPAGGATAPLAKWEKELHWGRLGDRRAVAPMSELILDTDAPTELRVQAGVFLTRLADPKSSGALAKGLHTKPPLVAAEAAVALGRMYDKRARQALRKLMHAEDPALRARAAVSLGRLRDRAAVPALIDALWVAPSQYEREEAVRWLGRLRDPRALEPLISTIPEFRLRYLVAIALGHLGDPRAFPALDDMLDWEQHTNIRDNVVRGLGQLGDARALPRLLHLAQTEPDLKNLSESLVRLGALENGQLGGRDFDRTEGLEGVATCHRGPILHDWDYLNRTYCTTEGPAVRLLVPTPAARGAGGHLVLLRARRATKAEATTVTVTVEGKRLDTARVDGDWSEHRMVLPPGRLPARVEVRLETGDDARLLLDHLLMVPLPAPQ